MYNNFHQHFSPYVVLVIKVWRASALHLYIVKKEIKIMKRRFIDQAELTVLVTVFLSSVYALAPVM